MHSQRFQSKSLAQYPLFQLFFKKLYLVLRFELGMILWSPKVGFITYQRVCISQVAVFVLQFFCVKNNKISIKKHSILRNLAIWFIQCCTLAFFIVGS